MFIRRQRGFAANPDRWLISYADFITLLFAFFVLLFASSHTDRLKARKVSDSVKKAFNGQEEKGNEGTRASGPAASNLPSLQPLLAGLRKALAPEIEGGTMRVHMEERGIVVSLSQASFFPSGEDAIAPAMIASLGKVADRIAPIPNLIRLEGHTDALPIHTPRFRSNWELSSARAIAMMELLQSRWHIAAGRLAVTGYGETVPIAPNDTELGRARNRRVDVVILNAAGAGVEPGGRF